MLWIFQTYVKIEIQEGRVNLRCPQCTEHMHPNGKILSKMKYYIHSKIKNKQPKLSGNLVWADISEKNVITFYLMTVY